MELYDSHTAERTFEWLRPTREIAGYPVRPGLFGINGAMALQYGVNFTIHTHFGTGCELLLFRRGGVSRMLFCLFLRLTGSVTCILCWYLD